MLFKDDIDNTFFTADLHLYHNNMIEYASRPFKDLNAMHSHITKAFNSILTVDSDLYIVGDVTLLSSEFGGRIKKALAAINGRKHLVIGNHDTWKVRNYLEAGITTVHSAGSFKHEGIRFFMMHDPAEYLCVENGTNVLLCGHIHTLFKHLFPEKRIINVGVDVWEYKPVSIEQIMQIVKEEHSGLKI